VADDWAFFVHPDGEYVSINDGTHGDTLLKMPKGSVDGERVRQFAAALEHIQLGEGDRERLREAIVSAIECMAGPLGRARSRALDGVSDTDQMRDLDLVADGVKMLRAALSQSEGSK
jgi:hypothetical protein